MIFLCQKYDILTESLCMLCITAAERFFCDERRNSEKRGIEPVWITAAENLALAEKRKISCTDRQRERAMR